MGCPLSTAEPIRIPLISTNTIHLDSSRNQVKFIEALESPVSRHYNLKKQFRTKQSSPKYLLTTQNSSKFYKDLPNEEDDIDETGISAPVPRGDAFNRSKTPYPFSQLLNDSKTRQEDEEEEDPYEYEKSQAKELTSLNFSSLFTFRKHVQNSLDIFFKDYHFLENIGKGGGGEVHLVLHKRTNQYRVVKQVDKLSGSSTNKINKLNKKLAYEAKLLAALDHPNIVKVHEVLQKGDQVAMVLEYVEGKDLSHYRNHYLFDSYEAIATMIEQILSALVYIHSKGVIHKDIKLQNIVLERPHPNSNLKLIDFGFSELTNQDWVKTSAGTIYYMAPEVLSKEYDKNCDVWSVGIILYQLMFKEFPFKGKDFEAVTDQILGKDIETELKEKEHLRKDPLAIQFLKKLLEKDPKKRYSSLEALNDPFVQKYAHVPQIHAKDFELFKVYHDKTVMELVLSSVYVHNLMTKEEKSRFIRVFRGLDKKRKGYICNEDFQSLDFSNDREIMKVEVNENAQTGKLTFTNLVISCVDLTQKEVMRNLFIYLDLNHDLTVGLDDLYGILEKYIDKKVLEQIRVQFRGLKNQQLSFAEFKNFVKAF